jgi:putative hydrolase of the HAD superfamily
VTAPPLPFEKLDALLVDLGNVMVSLHVGRFLRRLRAIVGQEALGTPGRLFAEGTYHRFARGELTPQAFHAALVDHAGCRWPYDDFVAAWCDVFDEIAPSVQAVRRVREVRPVFLLSNTDALHWESIRRRWDWTSLFSGLHLSFEVGIEKPEPRFFLTFLERHALCPARCLYVDDLEENVAAARSVGLVAVRQADAETLARTVRELLPE